jgi:hypothetical protein
MSSDDCEAASALEVPLSLLARADAVIVYFFRGWGVSC